MAVGAQSRDRTSKGTTVRSFTKAIYDNWRSFVSFLLTFVVIGVLLVYEPTWVSAVTSLARTLKEGAIGIASGLGWDTLAAAFDFTVSDIAIAWGVFMLLTRALIITTVVWFFGFITERIRGRR
jgi:uncharacterized membrane protein YwaF